MMKKQLLGLVLATGLATSVGYAGDDKNKSTSTGSSTDIQSSQTTSSSLAQSSVTHQRASKLLGAKVKSSTGENVGDINELIVDPSNGQIQFAVVGMGGFLGIGEKLTPVPWKALNMSADQHFTLNHDKQKLQTAPTIERDQWSQLQQTEWVNQVYQHYGLQAPTGVGSASGQLDTQSGSSGEDFYHKSQKDKDDLNKDDLDKDDLNKHDTKDKE